jgi:hypothetical protein
MIELYPLSKHLPFRGKPGRSSSYLFGVVGMWTAAALAAAL